MNDKIELSQQYYVPNSASIDNLEGGLNIGEFFETVRRNIPLIACSTFGFALIALLKVVTSPPTYTAGFELLSEDINIETKVTAADEDSRKTREEITDVGLDEVQLKILKSPRLLSRVVEEVRQKHPDLTYSELIAGLVVEILSSSDKKQNILQVTYSNPDSQKAEDVTQALANVYQNYSIEKRQSGLNRGIDFLDGQIPQIKGQSQDIQKEMASLKATHNFNNPESSLEQITRRIEELERAKQENDLQRQELNLALTNVDQELAAEPSTLESNYDTSRYAGLLKRLEELDLDIGQKSTIFTDRSEVLQALKRERSQLMAQISVAKADVRTKVQSQLAVVDNKEQSLDRQINQLKVRLGEWSQISGEYKRLQNQLDRVNGKLNEFNSQKDALQIDAARQESPWQMLTPAGEAITNEIGMVNYMLLGSTLGLLSGVGIAFLKDKQQNRIYSSAKLEKNTNLPILAAIPYTPQYTRLSFFRSLAPAGEVAGELSPVRSQDAHSSSVEAFRSLAANLGIFDFDTLSESQSQGGSSLRSIVVTSAVSGEGKSTVALNLARASAAMGKRVLLVDTDLRSSDRLTKNLGLESADGLQEILAGEEQLSSIQHLPIEENLFILPSGKNDIATSPQDSGRLLISRKMHLLMEQLKAQFDLVIYDLCAIIGFADVNLLAAKTDGIVFVAGLGKVQSIELDEALNLLRLCKAPVLGVAANKLVKKN